MAQLQFIFSSDNDYKCQSLISATNQNIFITQPNAINKEIICITPLCI